jgi:hypothetical protein
MSIEPVIDAEVVSVARADAERLDKRIRLLADDINNKLTKLYELVELAKVGEIHVVLGFPSWTAYIADVFGGQVRLERDQRREVVGYLSGEGMSQRAIAETVGVGVGTVNRDLDARVPNGTPDAEQSGDLTESEARTITDRVRGWVDEGRRLGVDDQEMADYAAMAELSEEEFDSVLADARAQDDLSRENAARICRERVVVEPTPTTGLDRKTYRRKPRPRPKPPRKRATPAPDADINRLGLLLRSIAQQVEKLFEQEDCNWQNVGSLIRPEVAHALDVLGRLDAKINGESDS